MLNIPWYGRLPSKLRCAEAIATLEKFATEVNETTEFAEALETFKLFTIKVVEEAPVAEVPPTV